MERTRTINLCDKETERSMIFVTNLSDNLIYNIIATNKSFDTCVYDLKKAAQQTYCILRQVYDSLTDDESIADAIGYDRVFDVCGREKEKVKELVSEILSRIESLSDENTLRVYPDSAGQSAVVKMSCDGYDVDLKLSIKEA